MAQETPEIKINLNGLLFSNATESPPNGKKNCEDDQRQPCQ